MRFKVVGLVLFSALCCCAQSPFDGTWKANPDKSEIAPDRITLVNGMYDCKSCSPPYKVKADGTDQPITGLHSMTAANVRVIDENTVEVVEKKGDKTIGTMKYHVGSDPNIMEENWTFKPTADSDKEYPGAGTMVRVSAGPSGSHRISGVWKVKKVHDTPDETMQVTYRVLDGTMSFNVPTGLSYSAKLDGKYYPVNGAAGPLFVSVMRTGERSFRETFKNDKREISVSDNTVSADGKTMTSRSKDLRNGSISKFLMEKQ